MESTACMPSEKGRSEELGEESEFGPNSSLPCVVACKTSMFSYVKLSEAPGQKHLLRTIEIDYEGEWFHVGEKGVKLYSIGFWNLQDTQRDRADSKRFVLTWYPGSNLDLSLLRTFDIIAQSLSLREELVKRFEDVIRFRGRKLGNQAQSQAPIRFGYAMKQGKRKHSKRFLVMFPSRLVVFKDPSDTFPPNVIELPACRILKVPKSRLGFAISFRMFSFRWETVEERDSWFVDSHATLDSISKSLISGGSYSTVTEQNKMSGRKSTASVVSEKEKENVGEKKENASCGLESDINSSSNGMERRQDIEQKEKLSDEEFSSVPLETEDSSTESMFPEISNSEVREVREDVQTVVMVDSGSFYRAYRPSVALKRAELAIHVRLLSREAKRQAAASSVREGKKSEEKENEKRESLARDLTLKKSPSIRALNALYERPRSGPWDSFVSQLFSENVGKSGLSSFESGEDSVPNASSDDDDEEEEEQEQEEIEEKGADGSIPLTFDRSLLAFELPRETTAWKILWRKFRLREKELDALEAIVTLRDEQLSNSISSMQNS